MSESTLFTADVLVRLATTTLLAAAAAAMATLIGTGLAVAVRRTGRAAALWSALLLIPFLAPPAVWALGQTYAYGAGGMVERVIGDDLRPYIDRLNAGHYLSTMIVLAEIHTPLAILLVSRGLDRLHGAGWESARMSLAPRTKLRWLAGALRREAASGWLLSFSLSLGSFAAPHMLQCRVYSVDVYLRMTNYQDPAGAFRLAAPLCLIASLAMLGMWFVERRRDADEESHAAAPASLPDRSSLFAFAILITYFAATAVLPIGAALVECRSPALFRSSLQAAQRELLSTIWIGVGAALIAAAFSLLAVVVLPRRVSKGAYTLAALPLAVPPLVIGLACLHTFQRREPINLAWLGDTSLLVMLGLAMRGAPFALRAIFAGRIRWNRRWEEAARLAGAGPMRRFVWLAAPLMSADVAAGAIAAYALSVGDVEISQMLCAPGYGTLALRLFTYLHFGPTHVAASLSITLVIVSIVPGLLYFVLANRGLRIV